jgi:glycosyltransferase involved in cell wall biosynthesis
VIAGKVSVVIPARNERFLQQTIDGLLTNAAGDVEIYAVLDGGPPQPLREDPRVHVVRHLESIGMREVVNRLAPVVAGEFLMKCDAHCLFAPGWDAALKADCDGDWVAVPTRHSVNGDDWTMSRRGYNYHYLTFPYAESMYGYGLHGKTFEQRQNRLLNEELAEHAVDDLMSFQGSCWFTPTKNFLRLGPLDQAHYYFYAEAIEVGMRQWIAGGRVVINKRTWYAHYHKGNNDKHTLDGRTGRGFYLSLQRKRQSEAFATDFWMHDRMPGAVRTFGWFIEHFWSLLQRIPTTDAWRWPDDWADPKHRVDFLNRPPDRVPAHL